MKRIAQYPYGRKELLGESLLTCELSAVRNTPDPEDGGLTESEHFIRAANLMFPAKTYQPNRWGDRMVGSIMEQPFTCWWGPAASTKTTSAALAALTYWLAAPECTYICVCSTTSAMLSLRIWGEIKRLYYAMKAMHGNALPANYRNADKTITFTGSDASKDLEVDAKAIIRGVAILQGDVDTAINNVIGTHNKRVMLIVDEAQGSREALIEGRINLRKGTQDFRCLLLGNPHSGFDPLGKYSEPIDGYKTIRAFEKRPFTGNDTAGNEVTVEVPFPLATEWKTKYGKTYFFNGLDAPSLDSPAEAKRLHFMIQRDDIVQDALEYGAEALKFWQMAIGFLAPEDAREKPFSEALFEAVDAKNNVIWRSGYYSVCALDPAFSSGGDDYVFVEARIGYDIKDQLRIEFQPPLHLPITPEDNLPIAVAMPKKAAKYVSDLGVPAECVVMDVTGNQHLHAATFEEFMAYPRKENIYGKVLQFTGNRKATKYPISNRDQRDANEVFHNIRTEAHYVYRNFLIAGHLAGVSESAIEQFCEIKSFDDLSKDGRLQLESKDEIRKRMQGKSPGISDVHVMIIQLLRERFGVVAGNHASFDPEFYVPDVDVGDFVSDGPELYEMEPDYSLD